MEERILLAGAGGQGALTIGKFIAEVLMNKYRVTWFPSYGAEVRGGTAHCHVVVSDREIANPVVEEATVLLIMNQASYDRFRERLTDDGLLVCNSSLVTPDPADASWTVGVRASELAAAMGDVRVANMIMLGALNQVKHLMSVEELNRMVDHVLGTAPSKARLSELNKQAFLAGQREAAQVAGTEETTIPRQCRGL